MEGFGLWLADPSRRDTVAAWLFVMAVFGTLLTLLGLFLTYRQARNARLSADQIKEQVEGFRFRKSRYDAFTDVGEAKSAIEAAGQFLRIDSWEGASTSYEEARKAIIRVRLGCEDLSRQYQSRLKVISDHLTAFCDDVDLALVKKGNFPEKEKVLSAIRRHSESLTIVQAALQRE